MADYQQVQGPAKEDGNAHTCEADESHIDKAQDSQPNSFEHTPLRPRRMEVHRNCSHHMFSILVLA